MTGKIAIIGDGDSITVFKAAGVATFAAENENKGERKYSEKSQKNIKLFF